MTAPRSARTRVFISYSHKDAEWLERLNVHLKPLEREGRIDRWDDTKIRPGARWQEEIRHAITSAKVAVLLISADFPASDFMTTHELPPLLAAAEVGGAVILPVIVSPSRFERMPRLSQFQAVNPPSRPLVSMTGGEREAVFVKVADTIEAVLNLPAPPPEGAGASGGRLRNVPLEGNRFFTGRDALLTQVYDALENGGRVALSGIGGVGKTQIALEYTYRYEKEYDAILWVRAESTEALISSFVAIAGLLNLPEKDAPKQELAVQAVRHWFVKSGRWLLILDNADDLALVREFIPVGIQGHLLLTTRAQAVGGVAHRISVEPMTAQEGSLFLLRRASMLTAEACLEAAPDVQRRQTEALFSELGGLPLALDQAGAFIEEKFSTLEEYLSVYQQEGKRLRELRGEDGTGRRDHPESVTVTFSLAFQKLADASPAAANLLRLCTFLDPEQIPEELFADAAPELDDVLGSAATNQLEWANIRQEACRLSLVRSEPASKVLTMHRLVQAVLKDGMDSPTQQMWAQRSVRAVYQAFPTVEFTKWPRCQRLLPQARSCAELIRAWGFAFPQAARLLMLAGEYVYYRGWYKEAETFYRQGLDLQVRGLGPEHPDVGISLKNFGLMYSLQGRYGEAEPLFRRGLGILERTLRPHHPEAAHAWALEVWLIGKTTSGGALRRGARVTCVLQGG
jgi:tetratricopeptide (TPR) repeat protein